MGKSRDSKNGVPPTALKEMAYQIRVHSYLVQWLHKHHSEVFNRSGAKGRDYVVAIPPKNGSKEPDLNFYVDRSSVVAFCKSQPVSAYDYRTSHKLLLMY